MWSVDRGATWQAATYEGALSAPWTHPIARLAFGETDRGWIVGAGGRILSTEDGLAWSADASPTTGSLVDVQYVEGVVYAVDDTGTVLKRPAVTTGVHAHRKLAATWGRLRQAAD